MQVDGLATALLIVCIASETARELLFKSASTVAAEQEGYARSLATMPRVWGGIGLWIVEMIAWVLVLERLPLTVAFPIFALTYAGIPLASALVLKEPMSVIQMLGACLVTVGVICVVLVSAI